MASAEHPGDRLDHGVVDPAAERRCDIAAVGCENEFPAAALADGNRHAHGDCAAITGEIRFGDYGALRDSGLMALGSATRFVNPSVSKRRSTPSGLTSTRSTSSFTKAPLRPCLLCAGAGP